MRRRDFVAGIGSAVAWPLGARAQQPVSEIGYVSPGSAATDALFISGIRQALNGGGYVEGRNLNILFRFADTRFDQLPLLASDLVARRVAAIVARGAPAALAVKTLSTSTPIVFSIGTDPVALGLVANLNRPGGNLTGAASVSEAFNGKAIELLHELVPQARSVARLANPTNPEMEEERAREAQSAARMLGLQLISLKAGNPDEIEQAFVILGQERPAGVLVSADLLFFSQRSQIVALAAHHRVIFDGREYASSGGLMSYGGSFDETARIVGSYMARILKGEKTGDLPVQRETRFQLILNLKTAKALRLEVPTSILLRADEVIE
jgi:putative ABC transport system substrate-binding protein